MDTGSRASDDGDVPARDGAPIERARGDDAPALDGARIERARGGDVPALDGARIERARGGDAPALDGARIERARGGDVPTLDGARIERARGGDADAFRALYERYAPMVHAVLLAHGPRAEADDLSQEVFLAAWRGLDRLRGDQHVGAWLAAIARNRGKRAFLRARPATDALPDEPADPDSAPARRDGRQDGAEALALLAELPPAYRETLAMRLVEGMTGPEIAAATGLTHGSVRVNLCRGMTLYEELLRKRGWPT